MESKDLDILKKFSDISIKQISKKLGIESSNVLSGRTSLDNYKQIKDELIKEVSLLFIDENIKNVIIKYIVDIRKELDNFRYDECKFDIEVTLNKVNYILDELEKKLWE